jgi:hypothetical protein
MAAAKKAQPNPRRGEIDLEIGGAKRTLKFGMNTMIIFGDMHTNSPDDFSQVFQKNPILAIRDMTYSGLLARKAQNDLPEEFTPELVGDWIDEMPQNGMNVIAKAILEAMGLGNVMAAPAPTA